MVMDEWGSCLICSCCEGVAFDVDVCLAAMDTVESSAFLWTCRKKRWPFDGASLVQLMLGLKSEAIAVGGNEVFRADKSHHRHSQDVSSHAEFDDEKRT